MRESTGGKRAAYGGDDLDLHDPPQLGRRNALERASLLVPVEPARQAAGRARKGDVDARRRRVRVPDPGRPAEQERVVHHRRERWRNLPVAASGKATEEQRSVHAVVREADRRDTHNCLNSQPPPGSFRASTFQMWLPLLFAFLPSSLKRAM